MLARTILNWISEEEYTKQQGPEMIDAVVAHLKKATFTTCKIGEEASQSLVRRQKSLD